MKKSIKSSTKSETFVDTSGLYALLVDRDAQHERAKSFLDKSATAGLCFITTDYILDEAATLLKARGYSRLAKHLFDSVLTSTACRVEWMDPERFVQTQRFFIKHLGLAWSFTDCFSFCIMREFDLHNALTTDHHFREAGFRALLLD